MNGTVSNTTVREGLNLDRVKFAFTVAVDSLKGSRLHEFGFDTNLVQIALDLIKLLYSVYTRQYSFSITFRQSSVLVKEEIINCQTAS